VDLNVLVDVKKVKNVLVLKKLADADVEKNVVALKKVVNVVAKKAKNVHVNVIKVMNNHLFLFIVIKCNWREWYLWNLLKKHCIIFLWL
jgi:hypothetical protein